MRLSVEIYTLHQRYGDEKAIQMLKKAGFDSIDYSVEAESEITYDNLMHIANLTEKKIYNEMKQILINQQVSEYEIYVRTSVEKDENTVYLDEVKIEIPEEFKDKISAITKAVPVEYKSVFTISVR